MCIRDRISEKYMEQIISQLGKAGFVRSVRGAQGGYRLAYAPEKSTAGQILRLTEGDLATVACLAQDAPECPRAEQCATRWLWEQMCIRDRYWTREFIRAAFGPRPPEAAVKKELLPFYARQWNHLSAPSGTDDRKGELT